MLFVKVVISIVFVIVLAEIAKRVNPILGGVLSGLPLGTGLSVYFISYEQGVTFLVPVIIWGIAALSASIIFCLVYLFVGKFFRNVKKIISILCSVVCSFLAFLIIGFLISIIKFNFWGAVSLFSIFFIVNIFIMKKYNNIIENISVGKTKFLILITRGIVVALIIVFITAVAKIIGAKWAAILSAFPSTVFALILVLHIESGNDLYPSIVYGFSYSVSTLAVFYISVLHIFPRFGLNIGIFIVYLISLSYLFLFNKFRKLITKKQKV